LPPLHNFRENNDTFPALISKNKTMRGSLQIARLFGIPVNVHWSFSLLFLFVAYIGYDNESGWKGIAFTVVLILALFFCVVLHEFGHALSARHYGVGTKDITILPIGGVARLDRLPEKPFQEFVVAVMGPMVNVVICAILALVIYFKYDTILSISDLFSKDSDIIFTNPTFLFLVTMTKANAWLVAFNMIPAFPMDGGRVFRALLSLPLGRTQATRIAALLGQICAVGFFIYGVMEVNPVLSLVSVFIFFTARQEYQYVRTDALLATQTVGQSIRTQ
jgi:Zn-dependent protease